MNINYLKKFLRLSAIAAVVLLQSCDDDPAPIVKPGQDGFFIVNEGTFGKSNTSLSYYDRSKDAVTNNVFDIKGDQTQSMTVFEGKGYIVVQNSSKIEVIDATSFSSVARITKGIQSPRYFIGVSSTKGYVSDWGLDGVGKVKIIDLTTLKVTDSITTGSGTNRFLKVGNRVYVANAGGYGNDNTVVVIDATTDDIIKTIKVGDNPNSLQVDKNGNVWVGSSGATVYTPDYSAIDEAKSTKGSLSKLATDDTEALRLTVDAFTYSSLGQLSINGDGDQLYYNYNGAIYSMNISATELPKTAFINKSYYGFGIDPYNGDLIGGAAPNFSSAGSIDIYTSAGTLKKSYNVGIAPNGYAFK
jgi:YVTN family beta-propeller protein